jgi:hypothetical protein
LTTEARDSDNSVSKPSAQKARESIADGGKPLPQDLAPTEGEPSDRRPEKSLANSLQLTAAQDIAAPALASTPSGVPLNGTRDALNSQRMKSVAQKTEIAGGVVKKLPDAPAFEDSSSDSTSKVSAKSDAGLTGDSKEAFNPGLVLALAAHPSATDGTPDKLAEPTQGSDKAAAQAERVAHLVNQEVVMIRQSGANSLAVSLKLDSQTELFLQLTRHDGQIQASVHCQRGNIDGLGGHWGELQESLARQNVVLMPLEDKISQRGASPAPPSETSAWRAFDQSQQGRQQRFGDADDEELLPGAAATSNRPRKLTTNRRLRRGWEDWA